MHFAIELSVPQQWSGGRFGYGVYLSLYIVRALFTSAPVSDVHPSERVSTHSRNGIVKVIRRGANYSSLRSIAIFPFHSEGFYILGTVKCNCGLQVLDVTPPELKPHQPRIALGYNKIEVGKKLLKKPD